MLQEFFFWKKCYRKLLSRESHWGRRASGLFTRLAWIVDLEYFLWRSLKLKGFRQSRFGHVPKVHMHKGPHFLLNFLRVIKVLIFDILNDKDPIIIFYRYKPYIWVIWQQKKREVCIELIFSMNRTWFQGNKEWLVSFFSFIWVWFSSLDGGYSIVENFTGECFSELNREVIYLGRLHHPNRVKLIGYSLEDEDRMLVYEYMPKDFS